VESGSESIRLVQRSLAFRHALVYGSAFLTDEPLPDKEVQYRCDHLTELRPVAVGGASVRLVESMVPNDPSFLFVHFGIDLRGHVSLLNPRHGDTVGEGMDRRVWNDLIAHMPRAHELHDSNSVREYGCAVLGLANENGWDTACDMKPGLSLRLWRDTAEVALNSFGWRVVIRRDWTISSWTVH